MTFFKHIINQKDSTSLSLFFLCHNTELVDKVDANLE